MILISVVKSRNYMTGVVYAGGHVIHRKTKFITGVPSSDLLPHSLDIVDECIMKIKNYLKTEEGQQYGVGDVVTLETCSTRLEKVFTKLDFGHSHEKREGILKRFNELPMLVKVSRLEASKETYADKYNEEEFVTEVEKVPMQRGLDLFND